jgi:toxin ParE1/3/4
LSKSIYPLPEAENELRAAILRYEEERSGLGDELWSQVQHALELISEHPRVGNVVRTRTGRQLRRLLVRRFPFYVIYREWPEFIEVIAFAHTSRRPRYWRTRGA